MIKERTKPTIATGGVELSAEAAPILIPQSGQKVVLSES